MTPITRPRSPFLAAAVLALSTAMPTHAAYDDKRLTVIVAVIDSLMPHEIGQYNNTPTLSELKAAGTWYTESRSVFSAETIPNHVAMMTGRYPANNGIPTNKYWNRKFHAAAKGHFQDEFEERGGGDIHRAGYENLPFPNDVEAGEPTDDRDLSLPSELDAPAIFRNFSEQCPGIATAAVMSKDYLYEVFSNCGFDNVDCPDGTPSSRPKNAHQPDFHFVPTDDPTFIPEAGLVPDRTTISKALEYLPDVNFMFINFGQVDRMGHVSETGAALGSDALERKAVLADTDLIFGDLVAALKSAGRWASTVLIVVSDHGMDWSTPESVIGLTSEFNPHNPGEKVLDENYFLEVLNGGTDSIYLLDPSKAENWERAAREHAKLLAVTGVEGGWFTRKPPPGIRGKISNEARKYIQENLLPKTYNSGHENFGDIVLSARKGYRFARPASSSFSDNNFIPGNHGHKPTLHNTLLVSGGLGKLVAQEVKAAAELDHDIRAPGQSENVDIAPTVAWLYGMPLEELKYGSDPATGQRVVVERIPYFDGRPLTEAFSIAPETVSNCGLVSDLAGAR